jgi:hypothetical protein
MSDLLSSLAASLNAPEAIVKRSAEARAKATGMSVEEVLAAWAGGAEAVSSPKTQVPAPEPQVTTQMEEAAVATAGPQPVTPEPALLPPTPGPEPLAPRLVVPPVLAGNPDRLGVYVFGSIALLALSLLLGLVLPVISMPPPEVRSSALPYSDDALAGRELYRELGCGSCHTQIVRALVADVELGRVTLSDTNQVIGYRRIGPDLSMIGSRINDPLALQEILVAGDGHPDYSGLTDTQLGQLTFYLWESA